MTDRRPTENQDERLAFPVMTELFGRPGVPMSADQIADHDGCERPIDHRAEAEEILAERGTMNDPNGLAFAHATLYLAEQQRIANQIAYLNAHPGVPSAVIRARIEKEIGL